MTNPSNLSGFKVLVLVSPYTGCRVTPIDKGFVDPCSGEFFNDFGHTPQTDKFLPSLNHRVKGAELEIILSDLKLELVENCEQIKDWQGIKDIAYRSNENELIYVLSCGDIIWGISSEVGFTITHLLSGMGSLDLISKSGSKNVDLNTLSHNGETPLSIAVKMKKKVSIDYLIEHGAVTSEICNSDFCSPSFEELIDQFYPEYEIED
ncbi:ankyrin repeat domain-containing protein [Echinimonas agarilytica]|uniref:Ankyrin repeat domain-containing protein n=1 Tax=Echinimonas agarilytica TaxID=1215918 RepID=A0AA41W809_9GAMM|nr:ankyrin repeat domain-containing protein [Echinimonas agarilytica]MCM2680024.1 ankyrin repeat domain-containing protein [Echinimonas agarilytica]